MLLQTGYDSNTNQHFYRPLGGGIAFGEHSRDAFAREIREELGAEVYEATLADPSFYAREVIALGDQSRPSDAVWVRLEPDTIVYPMGLRELIG